MAAAAEIMREKVMSIENVADRRHRPRLVGGAAEIDAALEAWARWARSALAGLGWPAMTLAARVIEFVVMGAASRSAPSAHPVEVDQLCELVERAVMRLKETERRVIVAHYLTWSPVEAAARRCHMSPGRFRTVLHAARRSVGDYLGGIRDHLCSNKMEDSV